MATQLDGATQIRQASITEDRLAFTPSGERWFTGAGAPAAATGAIGDWYLDSANGDYYEKTGTSAWTLRGNLKGPTGATGSQGPQGTPGEQWYQGTGAPAGTLGIVGDWYLDTANGDMYEKTGASTWTFRLHVIGPTGAQGATGATGPTGAPGEKWFTGSGAPAAATGAVSDWYLDSTNGDYYEKTGASSWTQRGNLRGPTGAQGPQGVQGVQGPQGETGQAEVWYSSAGAPAGATGAVGDWHLNTATGDVSEKTAASTWTVRGNIRGPQGVVGPTGPAGTVYDSDQIGTVKAFAGKTVPTNWMLADGRSLDRSLYPELFAAIGTVYGAADGAHFNLPDLRGRFVYASSQTDLSDVGNVGGAATHTLVAGEMPAHSHTVNSHSHGGATTSGGGTLPAFYTGASDRSLAFTTSGRSAGHVHAVQAQSSAAGYGMQAGSNYYAGSVLLKGAGGGNPLDVYGENVDHSHTGGAPDHLHYVPAQGLSIPAHGIPAEAPGTNAQGGGTAHNNLPPYIVVAQIVKVTGAQISASGALVGPTGAQGPQGATGATGPSGGRWYSGTGAPSGALAAVGDWYLNDANGDVYEKTGASAWTLRDNLTGPQGSQGPSGAGQASLTVQDTRFTEEAPYASGRTNNVTADFKNRSYIAGNPGTGQFGGLLTFAKWGDDTAGGSTQLWLDDSNPPRMYVRRGTSAGGWSAWREVGGQVAQAYAVTSGYTVDRAFNPEATSLTEVARVLGRLIDDMKAAGLIQP
jgi:microcystin-dependent protein